VVRCDNCGFQNPEGALVCRRCRRRLRGRGEAAGPRRESEGELTIVVAEGLTRLAAIIGLILMLGNLLAWLLYDHRVAPGMLSSSRPWPSWRPHWGGGRSRACAAPARARPATFLQTSHKPTSEPIFPV